MPPADPSAPVKHPSLIPGAIIFFLIGAGLIYGGRRTQARYNSYPTTKGLMISSRLHESGSGKRGERMYGVIAEYRFKVDGKEFTGTNVHPMMESSNGSSKARAELARYPAGKEVDVHYDPDNPGTCFLEAENDSFAIALQIAGGVVILLGLLGLSARVLKPEAFESEQADAR